MYLLKTKVINLALERYVTIYFYIHDKYEIPDLIFEYCQEERIRISNMYTHSKVIVIDKACVVMGSYNWLSCVESPYAGSENGSLVFQDDCCHELTQSIWDHIKFYRNLQFGNKRHIAHFSQNNANFHCIEFVEEDESAAIIYMPSPEAHQYYLMKAADRVEKSMVICSPFIYSNSLTQYVPNRFFYNLANRQIKLVFVVQTNQKTEALEAILNKVNRLEYQIIKQNKIHLKNIIMDDNEIVCGSFNWLSASRDKESDKHNHEASLAVWGEGAKPLVAQFYQSQIGHLVSQALNQIKYDRPQQRWSLFNENTSSNISPDDSNEMDIHFFNTPS